MKLICPLALLTFYTQTWEEYHTHTLTLGIVSGPVEGILTLCIIYAVTGYLGGGSFWQQSLLSSVGIEKHDFIPNVLYNFTWTDWYMVYGTVVLVFNTVQRLVLRSFRFEHMLTYGIYKVLKMS